MAVDDQLVSSLLQASRALVAIAARSLDDLDEHVTLPQYRGLVVLATRGPLNLTQLAEQVGVHVSTANRMCNHLVDRRLLTRSTSPTSSREVTLDLTDAGHRLIDEVLRRRRHDVARIVGRMPTDQRTAAVAALRAFAEAADETPEPSWSYGWTTAAAAPLADQSARNSGRGCPARRQ